ncbi:sodium:solute symporter [Brevibacterium marinum]|uniref:SSS family solute:Na+ symporter n=1 Tax=Brevibacterium marinum TaxID=418643 RepID=A0A846SDD8_9MICO|nr:sodium:solute symporter [Brevibacterium marinum]NJC58757.1 SSS family solute:Na+ symporter [Brevibacterium marinum]
MDAPGLGGLNWAVIIIYLLATLGIGVWFTRKASTGTESFFKANGRIPAWAAGFSIYATTLSAITYMSTPEQAFLTDWSYAAGNIAIFAIVPLLVIFYIPFFRKLDVTTAYEYLEERFGPTIRVLGSALFVLFHIGRVAIVIYLPTLAISSVTDISPVLVAAAVGVLSVVYTFLGGIEGVIWSDVVQGIILLVGAAVILAFGIAALDGGLVTVAADAAADDKFISADNWKFGGAAAAIPIVFLGSVFNNLHQYTASQDVVQRYQTTDSPKSTVRSLIVNGILALVTIPLFYGIGTVLYSYYQHAEALPEGFNTSALVPYFAVTALPAGISGLLIAAIFAAAQSTISSSLNSISACVTVDIRDRFFPHKDGQAHTGVGFSRLVIVIVGAISVAVALYLSVTDQAQTWDLFLSITGLFGVPLAGVFALGIFTRRANSAGVLGGLLLGAALAWYVQDVAGLTPFAVSTVAFIGAVIFGYVISLFTGSRNLGDHDVTALTIYGRRATYTRRTSSSPSLAATASAGDSNNTEQGQINE